MYIIEVPKLGDSDYLSFEEKNYYLTFIKAQALAFDTKEQAEKILESAKKSFLLPGNARVVKA